MIDDKRYAFGLDTEQYSSNVEGTKMMDWKVAALYNDGSIKFVIPRIGISWAFMDTRFYFNWDGIKNMDYYRKEAGIFRVPVGRAGYHVLYPSQDAGMQYTNIMTITEDVADWDHDRLVIDLELHQNQTRRTITNCTKNLAAMIKVETGYYPILYGRAMWLNQYTYPEELAFMDLWLAQYLFPADPPAYTEEYPPPPSILPRGFDTWLIHQTGDHCKPIGSPVKKVMDYNRWNGGEADVIKYFNYSYNNYIPIVVTPSPQTDIEKRLDDLEERVRTLEEQR